MVGIQPLGRGKKTMGAAVKELVLDEYEPFSVPEYFVTSCGKTEVIPGSACVRLYYGTERGGAFRAEYSVVVPIRRLASLCREAAAFAADAHNLITMLALMDDDTGSAKN